jgi:hypothetical protein
VSGTPFTTTALTPASTTKFAAELADGSKGHVLHSGLGISGLWTPALTFNTAGDFAATYDAQVGTYFRIGLFILATFNLSTSAFTHTTASSSLQITGLPFAARNTANDIQFGNLQWSGITKANYTDIAPRISPNTQILNLLASGSGQGPSAVAAADMPTGGSVVLRGSLVYIAAS